MMKKEAENQWKRRALDETVNYFDNDAVRAGFMRDALTQFCSGNVAVISNTNATVNYIQVTCLGASEFIYTISQA